MEGIYFFGEHLRWNLGWSNPNPAGAFVAMWIPWLWALEASKRRAVGWTALAIELVLWFLLCKTYSRGALVAIAAGGTFYLLQYWWQKPSSAGWKTAVIRSMAIAIMLLATGFFQRIDPSYVSQDASAENRLTLWKGGLQMISVAPWHGWGSGASGSGYMHWFQPLESGEAYAGMVNSYLHVGVERGLPMLALVLATALAMLVFSLLAARHGRAGGKEARLQKLGWAAGSSLVVFLVANLFSTLWIFGNLWWLPAGAAVGIAVAGIHAAGSGWLTHAAIGCAVALPSSAALCGGLWWAGAAMPAAIRIEREPGGDIFCHAADGTDFKEVLVLPDASVLGATWGKEIRRLAAAYPSLRFRIPSQPSLAVGDGTIIACGGQAEGALAALPRAPGVHLILVHPLGKPPVNGSSQGRISVVLPMLDTRGSTRRWGAQSRQHGWKSVTSPGVGQDVRLVWPGILKGIL